MQDFTHGHVGRQILNFAIPMLIGNVFMQLYQFADTVIVGRILGKEALAAVGAATPVVFLTVALIAGMGIGASIVISQYFGAKQYDRVRVTCDTLFIFLLGASVVMTLLGIFFAEDVLRLMGLQEDTLPLAKTYLQIYFGGLILLFAYNSVAAILRGVGDSKTPLYFLIISSVLNVGLDLIFILWFGWGVAGAAWATVISQGVAFILSVIYINRTNPIIRIELFNPVFDREIFRECVKLGLPTGMQQAFVAIGLMALMGVVTSFGTDTLAAYVSVNRIDTFISLPVMNLAAALTSFVGQNISVGNFDRIKAGLKATLKMSLLTCAVLNTAIIIFGKQLMLLFTADANVIETGYELLVIINCSYFIFAVMFTVNGLLRGAGAAIFPMIITLLSLWLIRLPLAAFLSQYWGETGIWVAMPAGWLIGAAASLAYYYSGRWKTKAVVKAN